MTKLPRPTTPAERDALDRTAHTFVAAIRQMFATHVGGRPIRPTTVGSYPVFLVGDDHVAKLFSPVDAAMFATERAVLRVLEGQPAVPSPALVAEACIDGWNAILMTRLRGRSLAELWPAAAPHELERVCESLGGVVRALHGIDPGPVRSVSLPWDELAAAPRRACADRQRERGLPGSLVEQIPAFLDSVAFEDSAPHVLLHTEVMPDHVFAERTRGGLRITGLIDFEPAMVGPPEYELASIGLFVARGQPRLLRAVLTGYGLQPDPALHRRIMGYTLLHRYSNLRWYLEFMPPGDSLEELAARWFGSGSC